MKNDFFLKKNEFFLAYIKKVLFLQHQNNIKIISLWKQKNLNLRDLR